MFSSCYTTHQLLEKKMLQHFILLDCVGSLMYSDRVVSFRTEASKERERRSRGDHLFFLQRAFQGYYYFLSFIYSKIN